MPIEIEAKQCEPPCTAVQVPRMVPFRVVEVRSLIIAHQHESVRMKDVRSKVKVGDVCVVLDDQQTYCPRILHCPTGRLVPTWYSDYLLFKLADDIKRIVFAKPENK